jgi:hypothetical protein
MGNQVTDFLFNGKAPPTVGTSSTTTTNVPSWLSDYTQGLLARANTVASEPYQTYGGPRVAGFDPMQEQAQNMAGSNVGNWKAPMDSATGAYGRVTGGPGALATAQPFLGAGTGSYTDQVSKYMDPYVQNVIDRSTELANRNFTDKIMPSINQNFVRAGAYGSAAQQRATGQAMRDVTGEVQSQARAALSDAYKSGADIYGTEAQRQLQAGTTAGNLYGQDMSNQLQAGQGLGALAQYTQQLGAGDTAALAAAGADRQALAQRNYDTAYGDFQAQRDYPKNQLSWQQGILSGTPNMGQNTSMTGQEQSRTGAGPSGISQIASILSGVKGGLEIWNQIKGQFGDDGGGTTGVPDPTYGAGGSHGGLAHYAKGSGVKSLTRLIHNATGKILNPGDKVKTFRGEDVTVLGHIEPKHEGSTGRVIIRDADGYENEYYPGVIDATIKVPEGPNLNLVKKAFGGAINHIPGPISGFDRYSMGGLRYARGGVVKRPKVGGLTLMRRISNGR